MLFYDERSRLCSYVSSARSSLSRQCVDGFDARVSGSACTAYLRLLRLLLARTMRTSSSLSAIPKSRVRSHRRRFSGAHIIWQHVPKLRTWLLVAFGGTLEVPRNQHFLIAGTPYRDASRLSSKNSRGGQESVADEFGPTGGAFPSLCRFQSTWTRAKRIYQENVDTVVTKSRKT